MLFECVELNVVRVYGVFFDEHVDGILVLDAGIRSLVGTHLVAEVVPEDVGEVLGQDSYGVFGEVIVDSWVFEVAVWEFKGGVSVVDVSDGWAVEEVEEAEGFVGGFWETDGFWAEAGDEVIAKVGFEGEGEGDHWGFRVKG